MPYLLGESVIDLKGLRTPLVVLLVRGPLTLLVVAKGVEPLVFTAWVSGLQPDVIPPSSPHYENLVRLTPTHNLRPDLYLFAVTRILIPSLKLTAAQRFHLPDLADFPRDS